LAKVIAGKQRVCLLFFQTVTQEDKSVNKKAISCDIAQQVKSMMA